MLVRSRMTADVVTVAPETTIAEALTLSRRHRIRHLPVVREQRLVGLVTDRDLRLAMPPIWAEEHDELRAMLHEKTVGDVMVTEIITVAPETPMEDAAKLLHTHRIGCVPVMDDGRLVGILTETDLLRAFVELFGARDGTTRIEVDMPNKPGELARVVRLIGIENRVNICGLVVPPLAGDRSVAIMHLQTPDASRIAGSLRKMGYAVGDPSLDADPLSLLDAAGHLPPRTTRVPVEL
jgi:acetoin utilization protein AcuB